MGPVAGTVPRTVSGTVRCGLRGASRRLNFASQSYSRQDLPLLEGDRPLRRIVNVLLSVAWEGAGGGGGSCKIGAMSPAISEIHVSPATGPLAGAGSVSEGLDLITFCNMGLLRMMSSRWQQNQNGDTTRPMIVTNSVAMYVIRSIF